MICDCDGWCDGQCVDEPIDWSTITVQIRPLLVKLENQLNEKDTKNAITTLRNIESLSDELLVYLYMGRL